MCLEKGRMKPSTPPFSRGDPVPRDEPKEEERKKKIPMGDESSRFVWQVVHSKVVT